MRIFLMLLVSLLTAFGLGAPVLAGEDCHGDVCTASAMRHEAPQNFTRRGELVCRRDAVNYCPVPKKEKGGEFIS